MVPREIALHDSGSLLLKTCYPSLWTSSVGESTKHLVAQLDPKYPFTSEQIALRDAIGQRLQAGFRAPLAIQLLIVNFLYSPPGLLRISNPQANLPDWLLADYQSALYETCLQCQLLLPQPHPLVAGQAVASARQVPATDFLSLILGSSLYSSGTGW